MPSARPRSEAPRKVPDEGRSGWRKLWQPKCWRHTGWAGLRAAAVADAAQNSPKTGNVHAPLTMMLARPRQLVHCCGRSAPKGCRLELAVRRVRLLFEPAVSRMARASARQQQLSWPLQQSTMAGLQWPRRSACQLRSGRFSHMRVGKRVASGRCRPRSALGGTCGRREHARQPPPTLMRWLPQRYG
jgi:hypothetical protein